MHKPEEIGRWPSAAAGQWPVTYADWAEAEADLEAYEAERAARIAKRMRPVNTNRVRRLPGETAHQCLKRRVIAAYVRGEPINANLSERTRKGMQGIINRYLKSRDAVVDDSAPRPTAPAGTLGQFNAPGGSLVSTQE